MQETVTTATQHIFLSTASTCSRPILPTTFYYLHSGLGGGGAGGAVPIFVKIWYFASIK